ncbi:DUF1761 domain-containing protein [Candidatus Parcubacteria bacterium]|nr:MAG: DUF1761 domain-containing protein [Candidatus Parcubacteria bacterium]
MVPINYVAVLVAAVAAMVLGYVWYGPLFGKQWMAFMGMTPETMEKMKNDPAGKNKMYFGYGAQFVGALVMAYVLAHSLVFASAYMNVSGAIGGLQAGFWSWLGFVAPTTMGMVLWEGKPWTLWMIVAGYWLVNLLLMGVIMGAWM